MATCARIFKVRESSPTRETCLLKRGTRSKGATLPKQIHTQSYHSRSLSDGKCHLARTRTKASTIDYLGKLNASRLKIRVRSWKGAELVMKSVIGTNSVLRKSAYAILTRVALKSRATDISLFTYDEKRNLCRRSHTTTRTKAAPISPARKPRFDIHGPRRLPLRVKNWKINDELAQEPPATGPSKSSRQAAGESSVRRSKASMARSPARS